MKKTTVLKIQRRLNVIAHKINEIDALIKETNPAGYVYFESAGFVYALKIMPQNFSERESFTIARSPFANFDCGGW